MQNQKQQIISKIQIQAEFRKIFHDVNNQRCFECGKQCRQWVQTRHAIYLCLKCAGNYQDIPVMTKIKSVTMDIWSREQLDMLKRGGNANFNKFLKMYGLDQVKSQIMLRSKAAQFYRLLLINPAKLSLQDAPNYATGNQIQGPDNALQATSTNQLLDEAKLKLLKAGETAHVYGKKAIQTIHHKFTSGEIKQDALKAADQVTETAKNIWSFVTAKLVDLQNSHHKENTPLITLSRQ